MNRSELISRILIITATIAAVGTPLLLWVRMPLIHAKVAENGGWVPDVLHTNVGEPLHLKLTSDDVVHGFSVGQMEMQSVDVLPGKVTDITLTFEKPGIYTFFCTRWCGLNHWRMRGTIEVGSSNADHRPISVPLYVTLGLDIDAPHDAPVVPAQKPSAISGQQFLTNLQIDRSMNAYRAHSLYQVFDGLNNTSLTEPQRWDVVAAIWQSNTTKESLSNGQRLYSENCAACHGENGAGNGVFANKVAATFGRGISNTKNTRPVDFTNSTRMLGASPALLQGKILRGGMGTGMPMWGSIFTEEQIWDLIAYLYSFQFEYHK